MNNEIGMLKIYKVENIAFMGLMPKPKLVLHGVYYYEALTIGVTRAYAALSANQRIDKFVKAFNCSLPINAEYAILEDGEQYRIAMKQVDGDDINLTLERLEDYLDVEDESHENS